MKNLVLIGLSFFLFSACKKAIEDRKEDIILSAMTNGQWYVYAYQEGSTDISSDFEPFVFQFYRDGKVAAIAGADRTEGTWIANTNTLSITSNFPGAASPLSKLNAEWKITDNSWDYVKAKAQLNGNENQLHLKKK